MCYSGGMGIALRRITTTGFETGHINCVLNSKAPSIQWADCGGRQIESRYKGVTLSNSHLGAVHSLTLPQRDQSSITLQAMTTYKPLEKENDGWETVTPWSTYFRPSTLSSQR
jgi:hypothetical protein